MRTRPFAFVTLGFLLVSALSVSNLGAAAGYIKIAGVEGESMDASHKGWSEFTAFSHAMYRTEGGSARDRGRVIIDDLVVAKELDKSSPKLMQAVSDGRHFPTFELHMTHTVGGAREPYLKYELKDVIITSYSISGSAASEDVPTEEFTIAFDEIKVTYTETDTRGKTKGNVEYTWKVEEGTA